MSTNELTIKVRELRELQRMADELAAEMDAIKDSIRNHMTDQGMETYTGTDYKITYKPVTTKRVDAKALKAEMPRIAARYTIEKTVHRLTVA